MLVKVGRAGFVIGVNLTLLNLGVGLYVVLSFQVNVAKQVLLS